MADNRPPLDRVALERVLARASELQMQRSTESDSAGALNDDQIIELGKEVGLTPEALRQAIAEERGRVAVPRAQGVTGGWFGTESLSATRVVPGAAPAVLATLDEIMRADLPFEVKRRFSDRLLWEPRRGFLVTMRTQLGSTAEGWDLRLADDIAASVIPLDAQRTHVRLDAMLAHERRSALAASATSIGGAAGMVGIGALLHLAMIAVFPAAGLIAAGGLYAARQAYRSRAYRVATALEQLLDRLEFGPPTRQSRSLIDKLNR